MKLTINYKKICSLIIILFMPLSIYCLIGDKVTIADGLLLITLLIVFLYLLKKRINLKNVFSGEMILFLGLIIINTIIQIIISPSSFESGIFSLLRYLLYVVFLLVVPKYFIDEKNFYKYYHTLGTIFALYSLIQFFSFYVLKIILPNSLPFLKTVKDFSYLNNYSRYIGVTGTLFRPFSCFIEPSYFSIFEAYLFYWLVNINKNDKWDKLSIVIIGISMMISGTTGIATCLYAIGCRFLKITKKSALSIIIIGSILIFLLIGFYKTPYGNRIINSIFSVQDNRVVLGYSTLGRISNYELVKEEFKSTKTLLIGKGVWTDLDYLPSIGRLLVSFGIFGTLIYSIFLIKLYKKLNIIGRKYFVIFAFSLFFTNSLFNITVVLALGIILMNSNKNDEEMCYEKNRISNVV